MKKEMFCDALKIGWFKEKNEPVFTKIVIFSLIFVMLEIESVISTDVKTWITLLLTVFISKIFALKYENSDFHTIQENQFHEKYMHYEKNPKYTFQRHLYDLCVGETIMTIY